MNELRTSNYTSNPFKDLRAKQGISQYELARRTGISKHAILRLEQGCYDKPLPSVLEYFIKFYPHLNRAYLIDEYADFQYNTRRKNHGLFGSNLVEELNDLPVGIHPLTYLRVHHHLNPTQVAKALCVPQSTVVYFERNSIHQHSVPESIIKALHDADYSSEDTDCLITKYLGYRQWLTAEKELTLVV